MLIAEIPVATLDGDVAGPRASRACSLWPTGSTSPRPTWLKGGGWSIEAPAADDGPGRAPARAVRGRPRRAARARGGAAGRDATGRGRAERSRPLGVALGALALAGSRPRRGAPRHRRRGRRHRPDPRDRRHLHRPADASAGSTSSSRSTPATTAARRRRTSTTSTTRSSPSSPSASGFAISGAKGATVQVAERSKHATLLRIDFGATALRRRGPVARADVQPRRSGQARQPPASASARAS